MISNHFHHLQCRHRKLCTRPKDCRSSGFVEELVILRGDDAATDNEHVGPAHVGQAPDEGRHEGFVAGSKGGNSHNMHITVNSLLGNLDITWSTPTSTV